MSASLSSRGRKVYDETGRCVKRCRTEADARDWVSAFGNRHKPRKPPKGYLVSRVTGFVPGLPGARYHTRTRAAIEEEGRRRKLEEALNGSRS